MQFVNPALLFGALLLAVPLIIHLLNRQRHKRRPWAAMEFLLRAFRKQRRRLRRENLLLLLLRCILPVVLALAVARPVLRESGGISGLAGTAHHILVLDASYSMGYRPDAGPSPFERGRSMISRLLDRLEGRTGQSHKVTVVTTGVRPRVWVREELSMPAAKARMLQLTRPEDAAAELTEAMVQVADLVDQATDPEVLVYLFTDLQARAFGRSLEEAPAAPGTAESPGQPVFEDTLRDVIERIQNKDNADFVLIDVGPMESRAGGNRDNLQITGMRLQTPVAVDRVPATVVVSLRNRGLTASSAQVTLEVDGGEPTRKLVNLEAGAEGEADFQLVFRETGRRRLRAYLQGDALEADDERFAVLEVRDRIRILMVEGSNEDDPYLQESYQMRLVLDPTGGEGSPEVTIFAPVVIDTLAFLSGQEDPSRYDFTVLANVERLNDRAATALSRALAAGRGLLVMLGDRVDAPNYNLHLYGAGDSLQPMRLTRPIGVEPGSPDPRTARLLAPEHPVFADFDQEVYREVFQAIPIYQCMGTEAGSLVEGARVLATVHDAEQNPLLVASSFGEGNVLYLTSAVSFRPDRWNRFEDPIVAFPLFHGIARWLALPAVDPFNVAVGTALTCSLDARPTDLAVVKPERDGADKVPVSDDSRPLPGGRYTLPAFPQTLFAGFYNYEMTLERDAGRELENLPFAVNVDPDEGELRYASHADLKERLGLQRVLTGLPSEGNLVVEAGTSELGPFLLYLLLFFVLSEAAMARYVASRRS